MTFSVAAMRLDNDTMNKVLQPGRTDQMASSLTETIDKLKSEIGTHITIIKSNPSWAEVDKLYRALGTIEELAEVPRTSLVQLFGIEDGTSTGTFVRVKDGEFYGLEPLEAAKRFLKRKGEAASLTVIMEALKTGGITANEDTLRLSLSRSTWDVAKVGDDLYGLLEFYPHVKRGNKGKKGAATAGASEPVVPTVEVPADEPTGT
jgi:hypothetical protein